MNYSAPTNMDLTFKSWLQTHRREGPVLVRYA